jgi:glycosyltransferase involved in cell wall biosynthesis
MPKPAVIDPLPTVSAEPGMQIHPKLLVFSSLFPHPLQPGGGLFIRERMFRVGQHLPIVVVSPQAWFPCQRVLRRFKPHFRPCAPQFEEHSGIAIFRPRFLSVPGLFKQWDGFFMALGSFLAMRRLKRDDRFQIIDAHFTYPDGYAATLLGHWFKVPVSVTLRGTEVPHSNIPALRHRLIKTLQRADRIFAVSDSLRQLAIGLGAVESKTQVVGNGVDLDKFAPLDRREARLNFGLPQQAKVLISVGALVWRKGFHRVIQVLPGLLARFPDLHYLIVGGASPEGNIERELREQVARLGLENRVHFLGLLPSDELKRPLSAADVFVLATGNEGWANVFLEAMACGLPAVTTDVGGNAEVVCRPDLGTIVPYGDSPALEQALSSALERDWDRAAIRAYAVDNSWDNRVATLVEAFHRLALKSGSS